MVYMHLRIDSIQCHIFALKINNDNNNETNKHHIEKYKETDRQDLTD